MRYVRPRFFFCDVIFQIPMSINPFDSLFELNEFSSTNSMPGYDLRGTGVGMNSKMVKNWIEIELNWIELNWIELNWIELNWIELNWIELNWIELNWIELNWIELNWIELNWIELKLNWIELNWIELNWIELDWIELKYIFPDLRKLQ